MKIFGQQIANTSFKLVFSIALLLVMVGMTVLHSVSGYAISRSSLNSITRQHEDYDPNADSTCSGSGGVPGNGTGDSAAAGETFVAWNSGLKPPYIMEQYIIEVLKYIADFKKIPRENVVTQEHVAALLAFAWGEGGDINNKSVFNLFNTSALRDDPDAMPYANGGGDGRQAYASFDVGIKATGGTMLLPRYTRLIVALTNKDSTASQVLYNYTHYSQFPGNGYWAKQNEIDGEDGYYNTMLGQLKGMQNNYKDRASTIIGTDEKEQKTGARDPSKLVYGGGGQPVEDPTSQDSSSSSSSAQNLNSCSCSASSSSTDTGAVSSAQNKAMTILMGKGLSKAQAAGIVGNFTWESGGKDLNTHASNGSHTGIAQWDATRWKSLKDWATANDRNDPYDLETQVEFSWVELTTTYKSVYEKLVTTTTAKDAAILILNEYEVAPGQAESQRVAYAEELEKSGPDNSSSSNSSCGGGAGGVAQVDGFTFPLITTKSGIREGVDRAVWCFTKQTNCHHDYNAADIHVAVGTKVIAAKEGTVVLARNSESNCGSSVAILGSDEQVYYYTHMQNGSVVVEKGQNVTSGTELGAVGDKACGAAPHLHFDMQPKPATNRPSCSGPECTAYTFLEVQPILIKSYEALPN